MAGSVPWRHRRTQKHAGSSRRQGRGRCGRWGSQGAPCGGAWIPLRRARGSPCCASAREEGDGDNPQGGFIEELSQELGFRVQYDSPEDAAEEEDWEEVLADTDDIWMREPAVPDSPLDDLPPLGTAPEAGEARPTDAWDSVASCSQETWAEEVLHSGTAVLLDVRNDLEFKSRCLHKDALHVPLRMLDQERVEPYKGQRLFVLDTGDARARQACVRLSRVFGLDAALALLDQAGAA